MRRVPDVHARVVDARKRRRAFQQDSTPRIGYAELPSPPCAYDTRNIRATLSSPATRSKGTSRFGWNATTRSINEDSECSRVTAKYPRNLVQPCDEKQRYVALWMERDDVRRAVSNVIQIGVNEARYGERPSRKLRRRRRDIVPSGRIDAEMSRR
ncbi:hypothetical protein NFJ02_06g127680 [Pycnococcus provasolii]